MKVNIPVQLLVLVVIALFTSCSNGDKVPAVSPEEARKMAVRDSLSKVITDLESKVNLLDTTFNREDARRLLSTYQNYYNTNSKDSIGGIYLYKAGRLAHGLNNYRKAISLFTNYHDGFPNHPNRADAALIIGIIYEENLHDHKSAKEAYQRVIDIHPGTRQAKDAEGLLRLVDMTNEEMKIWLRQQNKAQ
jgi:tetratricopeptide (TPR) repeat protein